MSHFEVEENYEFKWGKEIGVGVKDKEVKFYESFIFDGEEYFLYDCIYLYHRDEPEPYIGKLVKIWEKPNHGRKIKVLWFFRPVEIHNWLKGVTTQKNEIFLGCGKGLGLTNVNPLEVIVGKCNVICTSKDSRNSQPSERELKLADYIFYRTFDVGNCTISDKIEDRTAAIDVRYIFRSNQGQNPVDFPSMNVTIGTREKDLKEEISHVQLKNDLPKSLDAFVKGSKTGHLTRLVSMEAANIIGEKKPFSDKKTNQRSTVVPDKVESKHGKIPVRVEYQDSQKLIKHFKYAGVSENRPFKRMRLNGNSAKFSEEFLPKSSRQFTIKKDSDDSSLCNHRPASDQIDAENYGSSGSISQEIAETGAVKDFVGQPNLDHSSFSNMHSKETSCSDTSPQFSLQPNASTSLTIGKDKIESGSQKMRVGKLFETPESLSDDKAKAKCVQDSARQGKGQPKKADVKISNSSDMVLHKTYSVSAGKGTTTDDQVTGVRRPDADRRKWFKELPWEDKIQTAREQQTLVVLYNLDPSYTSSEVEDLIWHSFKEKCTAKVIPRTEFSSPYSGQAIVIFKSRKVAEVALHNLHNRCLLLPKGRVLIGGRPPRIPEAPTEFFGHLVIDKVNIRARGEMKEALSTGHLSQPNTIEYQMAMEWKLLQTRSEHQFSELYKLHEEELKGLENCLKTK